MSSKKDSLVWFSYNLPCASSSQKGNLAIYYDMTEEESTESRGIVEVDPSTAKYVHKMSLSLFVPLRREFRAISSSLLLLPCILPPFTCLLFSTSTHHPHSYAIMLLRSPSSLTSPFLHSSPIIFSFLNSYLASFPGPA